MLDEDVVAAVRAGQFAVHAIDDVDDGLRVLTGLEPAEIARRAAEALRRFRAC